ncbi:MAG: hypothetical protein HLUCCA04_09105 [Oceanicaulis sp. HLUCCA04]|nr:MAG: hypothetical protein HLUCCA04_09105 [Oceanicaulis sp. HLUCCA04]
MTRTLTLGRSRAGLQGEPLARLVYLSVCAVPRGKGHFRAEIADIISACERNNTPAGITGILIHDRGRFIQLLEGPEEAINRLFERIRSDTRHTRVALLLHEPCSRRVTPDWSMVFVNAGDASLRDDEECHWQGLDRETLLARVEQAREELSVIRLPLAGEQAMASS